MKYGPRWSADEIGKGIKTITGELAYVGGVALPNWGPWDPPSGG